MISLCHVCVHEMYFCASYKVIIRHNRSKRVSKIMDLFIFSGLLVCFLRS